MATGTIGLAGQLTTKVVTAADRERVRRRVVLAWKVRHFFVQRWRELPLELALLVIRALIASRLFPGLNLPMHGRLYAKLSRNGEVYDLGCVGVHLIVTAGKNYVAACFDNTNEPELLKFHGFGTGTTAPASGDTALQTELTTQYATDNTRPTGSQAHATNTYTTVATLSPDANVTVSEWGLFSASSAGTLFDRQTFTGIALTGSSDSLQTTYVLTCG